MAFPTTNTVLDTFNRTNGVIGSSWPLAHSFAGTAGLQIVSNQAGPTNDYVIHYYNGATYGPDCEGWVTIATKTTAAADGPYVGARFVQVGTGTLDGYVLEVDHNGTNDRFRLHRIDNGVLTLLGASVTQNITNGDKVGIEIIGSTLKGYRYNAATWTEILSRTDATHSAAGYLGLYGGADSSAYRLDDFGGGTAVPPATSLVMPTYSQRNRHMLVR